MVSETVELVASLEAVHGGPDKSPPVASMHAKSESRLARKYGAEAWEWMPNWGKVRNRLSERQYERHSRRMLLIAMIAPAASVSILMQVVLWWARG